MQINGQTRDNQMEMFAYGVIAGMVLSVLITIGAFWTTRRFPTN